MAIAFKPTCSLNVFALKYVNSQCQHDSLFINLAGSQLSKTSFYSLRLPQVFSKIGRKITSFSRNRQISVGLFFKSDYPIHFMYNKLWIISRQLRIALQYHDARYLCGVKGGSDRTTLRVSVSNGKRVSRCRA